MGDTIQFIRYAPLVKARGARVIVECHKPLARLFAQAPGVDQALARGRAFPRPDGLPAFDFHCPFLSLPLACGTTLDNLPAAVPYLVAAPALAAAWATRLAGGAGLKIGLAWAGNPQHKNDPHRSMALEALAPVLATPGCTFYSLQKGPGAEQAKGAGQRLIDLAPELKDFADTAAAIANLDLVIGVDTSVVHLAGALGKPAWVLVPQVPDWRWLLAREDSPWYPTLRLFRQETDGDWQGVFSKISDELRFLLERREEASPKPGNDDFAPNPAIQVSWGELIDKISILEIKEQRLTSPEAIAHVRHELALLRAAARDMDASPRLGRLKDELRSVNEDLWQIEDDIRAREANGTFDERFIELARLVYIRNDRRAALKREINQATDSAIVEEKQYTGYLKGP
jgi:hypothetical protein